MRLKIRRITNQNDPKDVSDASFRFFDNKYKERRIMHLIDSLVHEASAQMRATILILVRWKIFKENSFD